MTSSHTRMRRYVLALFTCVLTGFIGLASSSSAHAATVYGTNTDPNGDLNSGSRSTAAGELVPSIAGQWPNAVISWSISESSGVYTYEYTFSDFAGSGKDNKQISHWVLDITDNAVDEKGHLVDTNAIKNVMIKGPAGFVAYTGDVEFGTGGDNEIDDITGAVKFDPGHDFFGDDYEGDIVFKFESNREPVWGDVSVKAQGYLTNYAFGDQTDMDVTHYIARPDGGPDQSTIVPTPAALPAGLMLLGGLMIRRRSTLLTASRKA